MFNELTKRREFYSSTPDTAHFHDWNAVNMSAPTLYGYPYAPSSPGYVSRPIDVTVNTASYKHNSGTDKAGMQIHHRPTQDSANLVAAELRWNKADMARFDSMNRGDAIIKGALYNKELKRNAQTTISGHVDDFLPNDIINEADNEC